MKFCSQGLLATIFTCLIITSCKKNWFDVKSDKSLTVPVTVRDCRQILDNYQLFNAGTPGLGEVGSDNHYLSDAKWLELASGSNSPEISNQMNAYTWSNRFRYEHVNDWNIPYKIVFHCNLILETLNKLTPSITDAKIYSEVKGEALFYKSKSLYDLSQIFAQPYVKNVDSKFGLQIPINSDITTLQQRSSVHETYEFILKGLKESITFLPLKPDITTRPSKISGWGMLSRIYLVIGDFEQSRIYSDSTIKYATGLLNYHELVSTGQSFAFLNHEVLHQSTMLAYAFTYAPQVCLISNDFYKYYDDHDLRKTLFFETLDDGTIQFIGQYNKEVESTLFTGIALDEIYLNRAESNAQLGDLESAINDIEVLLKSRYDEKETGESYYQVPTFASQTELINYIYRERQKELILRGIRWTDLRRTSIDIQHKQTIVRSINGANYKLAPNSFQFTLPIPINEINYSKVDQNPGW